MASPDPSAFPLTDNPIIVYDVRLTSPGDESSAPPYFGSSPVSLLAHDLGVLIRNAPALPYIFSPFPKLGDTQRDITPLGILAQVVFTAVSLVITALLVASFALGLPAPVLAVIVLVVAMLVMSKLQGGVSRKSAQEDKFKDEAWMFVNGIATSASGLQLILEHLRVIFGRRVLGVHNRSFGIWWDLVESVLQRDFLIPTEDVRVGYQTVCAKIRDININKVVLMAHSQGGIIMSIWIDQLLADFAADELRKVEIYTFAAAANHFSVPTMLVDGERRYVFGAVEHFANTEDYVARIAPSFLDGVIAYAPQPPAETVPNHIPARAAEGRFAGRIFKREGTTGHMFLTHYLRKGSSILDHPTVRAYSQLAKYLGGRTATVDKRAPKVTVKTAPDATAPAAGA